MKTNNYFLCLFLSILFSSFSNYSCSDNNISSELQNEVKLTYWDRKGQDVYKKGDQIGDKIIVYFNGKVEKYSRYFESDDVLINTSYIIASDMQDLDNLFNEYKFTDYPHTLPSTNSFNWPSSSCFIQYSQSKTSIPKDVSVIAFTESKYYPNGFYEFIDKLKEKLNSFIN